MAYTRTIRGSRAYALRCQDERFPFNRKKNRWSDTIRRASKGLVGLIFRIWELALRGSMRGGRSKGRKRGARGDGPREPGSGRGGRSGSQGEVRRFGRVRDIFVFGNLHLEDENCPSLLNCGSINHCMVTGFLHKLSLFSMWGPSTFSSSYRSALKCNVPLRHSSATHHT